MPRPPEHRLMSPDLRSALRLHRERLKQRFVDGRHIIEDSTVSENARSEMCTRLEISKLRPMQAMQSTLTMLTLACVSWGCDVGSASPESAGGSAGAAIAGGASSIAGMPGAGGARGGTAGLPGAGGARGGTAGLPGAGGASGGTPAASGQFSLLYRDDFEQLDLTRWQLMTHSWDSNLALFSDQTVTIEGGELVIRLLRAPEDTVDSSNIPKPYLGAEVRSFDTLTYGRVRARMKFAKGSAVVSSLVTIYTPWPADDWNELDIECLGSAPAKLQLNTMVYTGAPTTPPVTTPVTPTQEPFKPALDFDPTADFHVYEMEWTPASARFSVDGTLLYTWTKHIDRLKLPQNVLLTIWASSSAAWAGPVKEDTTSAQARYDWVELYTYQP
jgi:hypothetical protein